MHQRRRHIHHFIRWWNEWSIIHEIHILHLVIIWSVWLFIDLIRFQILFIIHIAFYLHCECQSSNGMTKVRVTIIKCKCVEMKNVELNVSKNYIVYFCVIEQLKIVWTQFHRWSGHRFVKILLKHIIYDNYLEFFRFTMKKHDISFCNVSCWKKKLETFR